MQEKSGLKNMRIAIVGGGPAGLFMFKSLLEQTRDIEITIFEKNIHLGAGMPYSPLGATLDHITNVSGNEIPELTENVESWVKSLPDSVLEIYQIEKENFHSYKVLPRLLFGQYLRSQFDKLLDFAAKNGILTRVLVGFEVVDVKDSPETDEAIVVASGLGTYKFDKVIICTGHHWPVTYEGVVPGFYDAPYPPSKLNISINHPVAIKGSSLTAIDAIRTLARNNGQFAVTETGQLKFLLKDHSPHFKIKLHSRSGMLPAVRFHLDDPRLKNSSLLSADALHAHRLQNNGFLSLDYIFEKDFKDIFKQKDPEFYGWIKNMTMEEFVSAVLYRREHANPFLLLKAEYNEAAQSIRKKESVYWKELLGVLSFALNYPAKYLSAEDTLRLQKSLSPLISVVIAYLPQQSCEELLALHEAGIIDSITVNDDSRVEADKLLGGAVFHYTDEDDQPQSIHYHTYIDCTGQPKLSFQDFPFKSLVADETVVQARIQFECAEMGRLECASGNENVEQEGDDFYLMVPGIAISDHFQVVDRFGCANSRIYIMAVPYIGGFNPDYSGLDFCEEASARIAKSIAETNSYSFVKRI